VSATRVLILSWEYPPIVEGGLARHVRKLSEQLVRDGVEVHVVTRGDRFRLPAEPLVPSARLRRRVTQETRHGVIVHRVREPDFPRDDVDAFIAWVDHMNEDMRAAGLELGGGFDLGPLARLARRGGGAQARRRWKVPWLVTGPRDGVRPPPGLVKKHPQSHIHGVERRMVRGADGVITCSAYMREHVADAFGIAAGRVPVIPTGSTHRPPAVADLPRLRARFAAPDEKLVLLVGRLVYEKGFHLALEAMPG
jgi:glycogen(starch) synthase